MKKNIKQLLNTLTAFAKRNWIALCILIPLGLDVMQYTTAMQSYTQKPEVLHYNQLATVLASAENNSSIEKVQVTDLFTKLSPSAKVYVVKEGERNFSVLAKEGNAMMVVKHIPYLAATTTLSSKLLEKGMVYEWVEPVERPQLYVLKLFNTQVLSMLVLVYFLYFFMESSGTSLFKKAYSTVVPTEIEGDFSELVGYEDIKVEVQQLQHIITQKEQYAQYGIEGTFNILFSGKAGTGKSRFALYLAKELNVPIVSTTGSMDEIYVGSGAKKIRGLFKEAHAQADKSAQKTCILFIDEGEKLLRTRGRSSDNKWEDDTANELLAHLDGVAQNTKHHIIVIMASNFHTHNMKMDPAMLRRFNKKIHFRVPNLKEREEILKYYLAKIEKKEQDIDLCYLVKNMSGMTPAIIESVVQEAGLLALREETLVGDAVLLQAFERTVIGRSSRATTQGEEKVRKQIVTHELGHFLVEYEHAMRVSAGDRQKAKALTHILKISSESVEQIGALGFAMKEEHEEVQLRSVEALEWDIKQLYGGLAAEQVIYGKNGVSTGASNDIEKATTLLQHMINQNNVYNTAKLNYEMLGVDEKRVGQLEEKSQALFEESLEIVRKHEDLLLYLSEILLEEWSLNKDALFEAIDVYTEKGVQA